MDDNANIEALYSKVTLIGSEEDVPARFYMNNTNGHLFIETEPDLFPLIIDNTQVTFNNYRVFFSNTSSIWMG